MNTPPLLSQYLATAHTCADLCGKGLLAQFRTTLEIEEKSGKEFYDPVSIADRAAEETIRAIIRRDWPDHGIIGEEFEDERSESPYQWILDPIDGTIAFLAGQPMWGTLIGLSYEQQPLLGLMNQPFTGERYWATANHMSQYNSPHGAKN